jgi:hypothetical protein
MIIRWMLGSLAVWRMTHLLNSEDGPGEVFFKARQRAGGGFWGRLIGCFYCLSLWVAVPITLLSARSWKERALLWPGLSAGAIILEHFIDRSELPPPAVYYEDQEI